MAASVRGIKEGGRQGTEGFEDNEYSVIYYVETDDRADGPNIVMSAFGIPQIGDLYTAGNDFDASAIVTNKTATQTDSPWNWEVEVSYSTLVPAEPTKNLLGDNPLDQRPEVSYGFQNRRILIPGQFNDPIGPPSDKGWQAGIFAPNGELFDPQPEAEISDPILTIKRNIDTFVPAEFMALANAVNSDTFEGAEPRQLRLGAPQAVSRWHKTCGDYWEVTYSLIFRWETWDIQILNQGNFYWSAGKPASVWSTTTLPSVKALPWGEARLINLTTDGNINTTAVPTFTRIRFYREIPFSGLNLL